MIDQQVDKTTTMWDSVDDSNYAHISSPILRLNSPWVYSTYTDNLNINNNYYI